MVKQRGGKNAQLVFNRLLELKYYALNKTAPKIGCYI